MTQERLYSAALDMEARESVERMAVLENFIGRGVGGGERVGELAEKTMRWLLEDPDLRSALGVLRITGRSL